MISLSSDCLLFELGSGESVPLSASMVSVELVDDSASPLEPEFVKHAAASVFHYFKHDLGRETITVAEFAGALEKILAGFGLSVSTASDEPPGAPRAIADLRLLAHEAGGANELFFYPRLREQIRTQLQQSPQLVRFRGLRGCVKQLVGARRWSPRCEALHSQILEFLRECLSAEKRNAECMLVVE